MPTTGGRPGAVRRLFLDDDPERAAAFLAAYPDAVWVQTVSDCLEQLASPWDEVHLDHDLGGEQYVDPGRDDCGMEVVRWIVAEPRPHLRLARFSVHSHNAVAAYLMAMHLKGAGLDARARPFAEGAWRPVVAKPSMLQRVLRWLAGRRELPGRGAVLYGSGVGGGKGPPVAEGDDRGRLT